MARKRRSAFTLFEMILVVAVMLIITAVCYPSLKSMYGYYKLHGAVDSVRGAWAQARARAIEEGRPYRFSVEPSGGHYRIAPDRSDYWSGGNGPSNDPQGKGLVLQQALPTGVRFNVGGDLPGPAGESASSLMEDKTPASGRWTTGVIFLPDGTARDDVRVTFQVRGVRPTAIQLRGLTGNVTVAAVQ
jgi:type II secretory pathway pseudopilin PulG